MKKLFTLFLALVASVGALYASDISVDGIWYDFNESNKTATVTFLGMRYDDFNEYSGSVVIPSSVTYNGVTYSVTSIEQYAFYHCSGLTSVTIPNSVTSIGEGAFAVCSSLTSITIPNSVTSIGVGTFYECSSLTSVTIGNSVTSIEYRAFSHCESLTSVIIPNSVTSIGKEAFDGCYSLASVTIGNSVTSIESSAFNYCESLTYVTIPNSVTSIGNSAFYECSSLTSVTIPNSVTSIGSGAFHGCSSLTSITIPNSVTSIGSYAFDGTGIYTNASNWKNGALYINNCLIEVKEDFMGDYTIKAGTRLIADGAFFRCSSLTSVTIPNSVTSIGAEAFYGCSSLTSVTIPNSVTSVEWCAFYGCSSLTSPVYNAHLFAFMPTSYSGAYTIPNGIESIAGYAFYDCSSLTSVTIPNSVTSIGGGAFKDCTSLTSVTNYATQPQAIETSVFTYVDISACQLHVPSTSVGLYQTAEVWKDFGNIQPIRAEDITDVSKIIITPSENEVEITWPSVSGAASYELVIKDKDGNIVCTFIFNANGQLTSMAFNAPSRNGVPAQTQNAGFSFTINGLDNGTGYVLTLTAKDNSGNAIQTETISFVTTGGNVSTGIDQLQGHKVQSTKVVKDGQVLILRNGKTYTMQGQEVK